MLRKLKEIPLKQWLAEEGERRHLCPSAIYYRMKRGDYPKLKMRRVNRRVIYVVLP